MNQVTGLGVTVLVQYRFHAGSFQSVTTDNSVPVNDSVQSRLERQQNKSITKHTEIRNHLGYSQVLPIYVSLRG